MINFGMNNIKQALYQFYYNIWLYVFAI